jgi:hypothetical protein
MFSKLTGALCAVVMISLPLVALPQVSADKLVEKYTPLAGSTENAGREIHAARWVDRERRSPGFGPARR